LDMNKRMHGIQKGEVADVASGKEANDVQEDKQKRHQMAHDHIPELALDVELDGIDCALDSRAEIYSPIYRCDSS
jgi:hypothetical protein